MTVSRFDRAILKPLTEISDDGFLRAQAIVTRCGIFQYANPDGSTRNELRHPDDVFDEKSIASMKMLPVTNGHPNEKLVRPENSKRLSVGYTGELIDTDGHHVLANFVVTDQQAIEEVFKNGKNQLSLGYQADLIDEDGIWKGEKYTSRQKNIRYNHLALVTSARAGEMAKIALDSNDAFEIETVNEEISTVAKRTIQIDGASVEVDQIIADSFDKLQADLKSLKEEKHIISDAMSDMKKKLSKTEGERDSYKEKSEEEREDEEGEEEDREDEDSDWEKEDVGSGEKMRDKKDRKDKKGRKDKKTKNDGFSALVKERVKLIEQASKIVDSDTAESFHDLENVEIMKSVIGFKSKNVNLDSRDDSYIKARYDILIESQASKVNTSSVRQNVKNDGYSDKLTLKESVEKARLDSMESMKNAWKQ